MTTDRHEQVSIQWKDVTRTACCAFKKIETKGLYRSDYIDELRCLQYESLKPEWTFKGSVEVQITALGLLYEWNPESIVILTSTDADGCTKLAPIKVDWLFRSKYAMNSTSREQASQQQQRETPRVSTNFACASSHNWNLDRLKDSLKATRMFQDE